MLINAAIIDNNLFSKYVVFFREGWDAFTSSHLYIQVSDVLSVYEWSEKVHIFKGTTFLPYPSTNTRKNKFCIEIPLGNPSVELKTC